MNTKRWIAIIVATTLLIVSIGVNTLSFFFTRDLSGWVDEVASASFSDYEESIIEEGENRERIAVLTLDGVIQDTGNVGSIFSSGYNHQFFLSQLNEIYEDPTVKGVVLVVNSPGGGVVESADIYDGIRAIQDDLGIPVYVSMGGMAASGGYYVSTSAEKIFVNRETITGSIGVIMESMNYAKLAEKMGIDFNTIKTGAYKDILSSSREMTDEERAMLQEMIGDSYDRFVEIIADGRQMTDEEVRKVADGRIMNGRQAIEAGLADEMGKAGDAIKGLQTDYELENATVFEYTMRDSLSALFNVKTATMFNGNLETEIIGKLLTEYSAPRMMYLYGDQ